MSNTYKLQYNGMTLAYPNWNGYVGYEVAPTFKTLTLCASDGGTLTAETLTGLPGDTVQLSPTYDTYWRFSGYDVYGDGSITDNTYTFGSEDEQIVSAYFKVNAFTATGGWEKGSNVHCEARGNISNTANVGAKYAVHVAHTGDVPASWYSTSNRWKPSNVSAYTIRLMPKMTFTLKADSNSDTAKVTAVSLVGSTQTQTAAYAKQNGSQTTTYSKDFTTTTQNVNYGISAHLYATAHSNGWTRYWASADYIATGTTGTWSATGYAP